MTDTPPGRLLQRLITGPTLVSPALWLARVDSTNAELARRAAQGAPHGLRVLADQQDAGRGRQGRRWQAPAGTSLMLSLLLRPPHGLEDVALLPLLTGLTLVEACDALVPGADLTLKWPNDVLAAGRKCAGILVEVPARGAVVVGVGVNVDWRGVRRPPELSAAVSLSEGGHGAVRRWTLLPALIERFDQRYEEWCRQPRRFLPAYRERCDTLGRRVRVAQAAGELVGTATRVTDDGGMCVDAGGRLVTVHAGDVVHLRHR